MDFFKPDYIDPEYIEDLLGEVENSDKLGLEKNEVHINFKFM